MEYLPDRGLNMQCNSIIDTAKIQQEMEDHSKTRYSPIKPEIARYSPIKPDITRLNPIITRLNPEAETEDSDEIKAETICPKQIYDSKNWPGIYLSEIELTTNYLKSNYKPPFSYAILIKMSLTENEQLSLNGIYNWIKLRYPYYMTADPAWQNSIRHNLSLNKIFQKVKRPANEPGKGGFWRLNKGFEPPKKKREKENKA
ncbi:uncharacterized protein NESG_00635 [Nematocida ausubeli]|uniref:Forkhead transcription factor n=1 Tax=Nematocida ausubeli (strain ATCC PRA-371 / ERTm2) TaxID=1913371 RepID=H8ZA50_NEMA1|nr:uncharacterized protein NESG_00635 [Nematocida ausubeli]EHY66831.1 forkhead transcription factor [Nematocida ausubeli]KAI5149873.1 hypothetical protein NEAUS05_1941 [Nematocida ausubeli]KAI5150410.1 hypothetical protein NEAUS05_2156 [Nematocida ausubeli]KFG26489.1 hypothetical protein NESG_00635 [Nematocida ausubeli]